MNAEVKRHIRRHDPDFREYEIWWNGERRDDVCWTYVNVDGGWSEGEGCADFFETDEHGALVLDTQLHPSYGFTYGRFEIRRREVERAMSDGQRREMTVGTPKGIEKAVASQKGIQRAIERGPVERPAPKPVERKG